MKIKFAFASLIGALFIASCSDDNTEQPTRYVPLGQYDSGVLILNEGGLFHNDASVSYLSFDFSKLENDIFSLSNDNAVLGDVGQDMCFYGEFAYIVVNGSNKIEIVNRYTMKSVGTIESGLSNPRYMVVYNGKGYVTNWGNGSNVTDDYVAVIDLATRSVVGTIPVVEGPERILEYNSKLYVAQTGGYGYGNKISVIKTSDNSVSTIAVGDIPNAMQIKNGDLWVSYGGKPSYAPVETSGGLVKINTATDAVSHTYPYSGTSIHPSNLVIYGEDAFYTIGSGVYKFSLGAASLPTAATFNTINQAVGGIYSFAIKQNHMYVGDAGDYEHNGKVYIYSTGIAVGQSPLGTLENTYTVGVIPTGFYFNF